MRIISLVGARPQFIKVHPLSLALNESNKNHHRQIEEIIVHSGQHYDFDMSQSFFDELGIPPPSENLGVGSGTHGEMTAAILRAIEAVLIKRKPDMLLVFGDTNTTLAGALAASKLGIPIGHVEAGLRSFNWSMPEEQNRVVADRLSDYKYCPSNVAVSNLEKEGIRKGVLNVGDIMFDAVLHFRERANKTVSGKKWGLNPEDSFVVATIHRAENTDSREALGRLLEGLQKIAAEIKVIMPLHPRTRKMISEFGLEKELSPIKVTNPASYIEMLWLMEHSKGVLTDSGGMQKEAMFLGCPCITLRQETEWVETVDLGWNALVGTDPDAMYEMWTNIANYSMKKGSYPYGDGTTASQIVDHIRNL